MGVLETSPASHPKGLPAPEELRDAPVGLWMAALPSWHSRGAGAEIPRDWGSRIPRIGAAGSRGLSLVPGGMQSPGAARAGLAQLLLPHSSRSIPSFHSSFHSPSLHSLPHGPGGISRESSRDCWIKPGPERFPHGSGDPVTLRRGREARGRSSLRSWELGSLLSLEPRDSVKDSSPDWEGDPGRAGSPRMV